MRVLRIIQSEGITDAVAHGRDGLVARGWTPLAKVDFDVATAKTRTVLYADAVRTAVADPGIIQRRIDDENDRPRPDAHAAAADPQATPGARSSEATPPDAEAAAKPSPSATRLSRMAPWATRRWRSQSLSLPRCAHRARQRRRRRRCGLVWNSPLRRKRCRAPRPLRTTPATAHHHRVWLQRGAHRIGMLFVMSIALLAYTIGVPSFDWIDATHVCCRDALWTCLNDDMERNDWVGSARECQSKTNKGTGRSLAASPCDIASLSDRFDLPLGRFGGTMPCHEHLPRRCDPCRGRRLIRQRIALLALHSCVHVCLGARLFPHHVVGSGVAGVRLVMHGSPLQPLKP